MDHASEDCKRLCEWVKDPERWPSWQKKIADSWKYGEDNYDCTFIVFSAFHLACRSLENKLAHAAKDAGMMVSCRAIEYAASRLLSEREARALKQEAGEQ